ncbi:MAG: cob(I)yrinic acid a,c-diamide adenosyltransferase [Pirellulales bacterium]|nr:cob(I)yrinic acid a,c-diamide adenosyltransferase [Pirellulales bacterium]
MAKIYTKTGDDGQTGLIGGQRVAKNDIRIEAYGTVDELNATLGVARGADPNDEVDRILQRIQNELFDAGSRLATPLEVPPEQIAVTRRQTRSLETEMDHFEQQLPALTQFILPAGSRLASQLHLARTVCRRAERCVVGLKQHESDRKDTAALGIYLNRLGDLLFVLARVANHESGAGDVPWMPDTE